MTPFCFFEEQYKKMRLTGNMKQTVDYLLLHWKP